MENVPPPFERLVGEELSGVTFVRDYIQLQFNPPPILNILNPIFLDVDSRHVMQDDVAFANAMIAQIGKVINDVLYCENDYLKLVFSDDSNLVISINPEDYVGPEAIQFFGKNKEWGVI